MEHTSLSRNVRTMLTISKCQTGNTVPHVLEPIYPQQLYQIILELYHVFLGIFTSLFIL